VRALSLRTLCSEKPSRLPDITKGRGLVLFRLELKTDELITITAATYRRPSAPAAREYAEPWRASATSRAHSFCCSPPTGRPAPTRCTPPARQRNRPLRPNRARQEADSRQQAPRHTERSAGTCACLRGRRPAASEFPRAHNPRGTSRKWRKSAEIAIETKCRTGAKHLDQANPLRLPTQSSAEPHREKRPQTSPKPCASSKAYTQTNS